MSKTFTLTATLDGKPVPLLLSFDTIPFDCVMIHEFRDGQWIGGPSYGNWFSGDATAVLAEMNVIGLKAWIKKYIVSWVKLQLINSYGNRMKPGAAPPPAVVPDVITQGNVSTAFAAIMESAVWNDVDGDGLPELSIP